MASKVSIIGAGGMGSWFACAASKAGYLTGVHDIVAGRAESVSRKCGSLVLTGLREAVEWGGTVLLAIPGKALAEEIPKLSSIYREMSVGLASRGPVVFDLSTFKLGLIKYYKFFPEWVSVATIHPLFGPKAARNSRLLKAAVIPIPGRERGAVEASEFLRSIGVRPFIVDAETHDRIVARTIGASYAVGLALALVAAEAPRSLLEELSGTTYRYLATHYRAIASDPVELKLEILSNPMVREEIGRIIGALKEIIRDPRRACDKAAKAGIGSGEAYAKLYKCIENC